MSENLDLFKDTRSFSPALYNNGNERVIYLGEDHSKKNREGARIYRPKAPISKNVLVDRNKLKFLDNFKILVLDTETTGLPTSFNAPATDVNAWPRMVELAFGILKLNYKTFEIEKFEIKDFIIAPDGYSIPEESTKIHGITNDEAELEGIPINDAFSAFSEAIKECDLIIAHNEQFDSNVIRAELFRMPIADRPSFEVKPKLCTKLKSVGLISNKWPRLEELYFHFFFNSIPNQHRADGDVLALGKVFSELLKYKVIDLKKEFECCK